MTDAKRVSANEDARRVAESENDKVNGFALCMDRLWADHQMKVETLRARQAAYHDTLPTDPNEIISAARKILHPGGAEYPDGLKEAVHLSEALNALVLANTGGDSQAHAAALFLSGRMSDLLDGVAKDMARLADILGNPVRMEHEEQREKSAALFANLADALSKGGTEPATA